MIRINYDKLTRVNNSVSKSVAHERIMSHSEWADEKNITACMIEATSINGYE